MNTKDRERLIGEFDGHSVHSDFDDLWAFGNEAAQRLAVAAPRLLTELRQLHARLEAAEKDAARYRWLRSTQNTECDHGSLEDLAWFALHNESPEACDKAIDAALASTPPPECVGQLEGK